MNTRTSQPEQGLASSQRSCWSVATDGCASRVATAERDAGAALGRISRRGRRSGQLRVLLVLRFVSRMGQTAEANPARRHTAGERVFVDFAGHTMEVIDGSTGEIRQAAIFVGVLGASSYTFAEAPGHSRYQIGLPYM